MRIKEEFEEYISCILCGRECGVNRNIKNGYCGEGSKLSIDSALIHFGEEPPISGEKGSGAIFFTGCSLRCVFCQNMQISQRKNPGEKKYYSTEELIDIICNLINKGAENINFVTPDHFLPHIIEAVKYLKNKKIEIPFIYNCSGYQSLKNLEIASKWMDIFLIDYKFSDSEASFYCTKTKDYPEVALEALKFLYNTNGNLMLNKNGKAISGVIVRHLVIPGFIENSLKVLYNLYDNFGKEIYISLMAQYTPQYLKNGFDRINRRLTTKEFKKVEEYLFELGFTNGYIQEFIDNKDKYIPDFDTKKIYDEW